MDREEFLEFTRYFPPTDFPFYQDLTIFKSKRNLSPVKREVLLAALDTDGDGKVDLDEFRQLFDKN